MLLKVVLAIIIVMLALNWLALRQILRIVEKQQAQTRAFTAFINQINKLQRPKMRGER
jgi:hypothetical protein